MSEVRVRKLQEFIKQEASQILLRGLKDPRIGSGETTVLRDFAQKRWLLPL